MAFDNEIFEKAAIFIAGLDDEDLFSFLLEVNLHSMNIKRMTGIKNMVEQIIMGDVFLRYGENCDV
jgi:hypothetical protein